MWNLDKPLLSHDILFTTKLVGYKEVFFQGRKKMWYIFGDEKN